MHTTHDPILVLASIVIACLASFAALDLAGRVAGARGATRAAWLTAGAVVMGSGIWSMHFVAMLAFQLPVPVSYYVPLVMLSVLVAVAASALALFVAGRETVRTRDLVLTGPLMGAAISGMHYIGMAAIRTSASQRYDPALVAISVVVAIVASYAALLLFLRFRHDTSRRGQWLRAASAIVMGHAIVGMHFTAMTAVRFSPRTDPPLGDGYLIPSAGLAVPVVAVSLVILGAAVVGMVATPWARSQRAIRQSEERFRLLVDTVQDYAILFLDPRGCVVSWNQGAERLTGYSAGEIMGQHVSLLLPPEDRARAEAGLRSAAVGGRHVDEGVRVRRDGSRFWVHATTSALRDERGQLVGYAKITRDVSERRQAEQALRESEARHRVLFERNPLPMWVYDTESLQFIAVNAAAIAQYGYSREEFLRMRVTDLRLPEEVPDLLATRFAAGQGRNEVGSHRHRRKDGSVIWVDVVSDDAWTGEGPTRVVLAHDISQRTALEEQLRQSQKMEAVGQLAGGIAHDFNNILTVIRSFSEMLLEELPRASRHRSDVTEIRAAADRAAILTRQLLAFSRRQLLQPVVLDLNDVLRGLEGMLARLLGEDVGSVWHLAPDLGRVKADPGQVEQIVVNLAINARHAMPRGGRLTIETKNVTIDEAYAGRVGDIAAGRHVLLSVSDTGSGMDAATRARIFDPFFTTKAPGQGTGLGLSTVFGIVKQSDGHIAVYSEVGHGTTFRIYLPHSEAQRVSASVAATVAAPETGGGETVLIVEDDPAVRLVASRILRRQGYRVLEAPGPAEAQALVAHHPCAIDLVLSDLVLPEMNGRELAERLVAARPGMRVLFMSGYTDDAVIRRGLLEPGMAFLSKPFTFDDVARAVRGVLERV